VFIMKWAFVLCVLTFLISTVFVAPFLSFNQKEENLNGIQNEVASLRQKTNELAHALIAKDKVIEVFINNAPSPIETLHEAAAKAFHAGDFPSACEIYDKFLSSKRGSLWGPFEQTKFVESPLYICAALETNRISDDSTNMYPFTAIGKFDNGCTDITNQIGHLIRENSDNIQNTPRSLSWLNENFGYVLTVIQEDKQNHRVTEDKVQFVRSIMAQISTFTNTLTHSKSFTNTLGKKK